MNNRNPDVDAFMDSLDHPMRSVVQHVRLAILRAEPQLAEHIKWKAPSFYAGTVDRVTFTLRATDGVHLIFHRGAKAVDDGGGFRFVDPTGLLEMITPERGQVRFTDGPAALESEPELLALVHAWVRA